MYLSITCFNRLSTSGLYMLLYSPFYQPLCLVSPSIYLFMVTHLFPYQFLSILLFPYLSNWSCIFLHPSFYLSIRLVNPSIHLFVATYLLSYQFLSIRLSPYMFNWPTVCLYSSLYPPTCQVNPSSHLLILISVYIYAHPRKVKWSLYPPTRLVNPSSHLLVPLVLCPSLYQSIYTLFAWS